MHDIPPISFLSAWTCWKVMHAFLANHVTLTEWFAAAYRGLWTEPVSSRRLIVHEVLALCCHTDCTAKNHTPRPLRTRPQRCTETLMLPDVGRWLCIPWQPVDKHLLLVKLAISSYMHGVCARVLSEQHFVNITTKAALEIMSYALALLAEAMHCPGWQKTLY